MKISTRGRYAIRVMLDLAEHNTGGIYSVDGYSKKTGRSQRNIWKRLWHH